MVRVRFAPSPTGYLHIGSARTALFNWLYAKHNNGKFILRIEDTDKERSKEEFLEEILGSLKWLFMDWDEELTFQSKRFDIYKKYAEELVKQNLAYMEGPAIIFRVEKEKKIAFEDMIHGTIEVSTNEIKDQVLMKSDGTPTYNFACVIDDAMMKITHIIRGDDHISNTPKQVMLYEAMCLPLPKFAHIPLILSKGGGRMSKRHGATSIFEYKNMGFLPEALVNYLSLMGWAPGNDREILPIEELVKLFDVKDVNKTGATFDMDKLVWINSQYIKDMPIEKLLPKTVEYLKDKKVLDDKFDEARWTEVVKAYKERTRTLEDLISVYKIFFGDTLEYDEKATEKYLKKPNSKDIISKCKTAVEGLAKYDKHSIEEAYRKLAEEMKCKAAELIHPTRVAISGKTVGAGLFDMMEILGRNTVLQRLGKFC
ncbi:MAG: glutamate--tRNA ligase [Candidatus Omnitrophica bacterium]|nr:glutamate--tRNA ligase [Candidatus Omnitrophota bacterium]